MNLHKIYDVNIRSITEKYYNIAFFACGYEERATALSNIISKNNIHRLVTIYFNNQSNIHHNTKNSKHFNMISNDSIRLNDNDNDDKEIFNYLNSYLSTHLSQNLNILIDYSSMPRLWYITLINWAKNVVTSINKICIDFVYNVGSYDDIKLTPLLISKILAIPGHEGITTHNNTITIFGLGYDEMATLCVHDVLEPSMVYSVIMLPPGYENINCKPKLFRAEIENKTFLSNYSKCTLYLPLISVEKTYRLINEFIMPFMGKNNISFIPMGPKPHILASALISTKFQDIINLYVKGKRESKHDVHPSTDFVCTRVEFINH